MTLLSSASCSTRRLVSGDTTALSLWREPRFRVTDLVQIEPRLLLSSGAGGLLIPSRVTRNVESNYAPTGQSRGSLTQQPSFLANSADENGR